MPAPSPAPTVPACRSSTRSRDPAPHAMPVGPPLPEGTVAQPILAVLGADGLLGNRECSLLANTFCSRTSSFGFRVARATPPAPATKNNSSSESLATAAISQKTAARAKAALSTSRPNQKMPQPARPFRAISCDFPRHPLPAPRNHSLREILPSLQQHRQPSHKAKSRRDPRQNLCPHA